MTIIPYSRQDISEDDIAAVADVLRSDFLTTGPEVPKFEQAIASYVAAQHAVAVASATAGLHLACIALGVGRGTSVWTSTNSFAASANCARYCGAAVTFLDIDPATGNLCIDALEAKLNAGGKRPTALIAVHYSGRPLDMPRIAALAKLYNFRVIEDAAHALGAAYTDGTKVGSGHHSDATVFSFHPVKPITTGEGGIVTTQDPTVAERIALLRSHGITRDDAQMEDTYRLSPQDDGAWYYQMQLLGYHYRMTDIQAALGRSQLKRLDAFIQQRQQIVQRYHSALADHTAITCAPWQEGCGWHLFPILLPNTQMRKHVFETLRSKDIAVNVHYIPIHHLPYYQRLGHTGGSCPHAEDWYARTLSLPVHTKLTDADQQRVIDTLLHAVQHAQKAAA